MTGATKVVDSHIAGKEFEMWLMGFEIKEELTINYRK